MFEVYVSNNSRLYLDALRSLNERRKKRNRGEEVEKTPDQWSMMDEKEKRIMRYGLVSLFYFIWLVIGALFSSQWIIFLALISFGFAVGYYRRRMLEHRTREAVNLVKFDAVVSALTLAFIIINHFHHIL